MSTNCRNGLTSLPSTIGARVLGEEQEIPDATATALVLTTPLFNRGAVWASGSPTRMTAPRSGFYLLFGSVNWRALAQEAEEATPRLLFFMKNGDATDVLDLVSQMELFSEEATIGTAQSLSTVVHLAKGDYVELMAQQLSGAPLDVLASTNHSPLFGMIRLK